jgi:hypothetical protein
MEHCSTSYKCKKVAVKMREDGSFTPLREKGEKGEKLTTISLIQVPLITHMLLLSLSPIFESDFTESM